MISLLRRGSLVTSPLAHFLLATLYPMLCGGVKTFDIKSRHIKRGKAPLEEHSWKAESIVTSA